MHGPVSQISEDMHLLDLSRIRGGGGAILDRLPQGVPGVYAWFRTYQLPDEGKSTTEFLTCLLGHLDLPQFAPREASIPPGTMVRIESRPSRPTGKLPTIERLCLQPDFRELLRRLLARSIYFQQPLYVGKAACIRTRIGQHLREESPLRLRLARIGIQLEYCRLLVHSLPGGADAADDHDGDPEAVATVSEDDDEFTTENVLEDILSRLFSPAFGLRTG